jgi:hypothetical protein
VADAALGFGFGCKPGRARLYVELWMQAGQSRLYGASPAAPGDTRENPFNFRLPRR